MLSLRKHSISGAGFALLFHPPIFSIDADLCDAVITKTVADVMVPWTMVCHCVVLCVELNTMGPDMLYFMSHGTMDHGV